LFVFSGREWDGQLVHPPCSHLRLLSLRTCSVRETGILVEQQPPQGVLVCDHAGLVINKFSPRRPRLSGTQPRWGDSATHL